MAEVMYQQVSFTKPGVAEEIRWIDSKMAVEGAYRKRKIDGEWSDGWLVAKVYPNKVSESTVLDIRDRSKYHREATDV